MSKIIKEIKINKNQYESLINDSKFVKGDEGPKKLGQKSLDNNLNKELSILEKIDIKIGHNTSSLKFNLSRRDSKHLNAYGRCCLVAKCPVNYCFYISNIPSVNSDYVNITVEITNNHNHESFTNQIRGNKRIELGEKIILNNGGSSHETRTKDLFKAETEEITIPVPKLETYRKCKSAFNHKDVPTNEC